jgi:hypothetical protein
MTLFQQRLEPRSIDTVDLDQTVDPLLLGQCLRATQHFVRVVLDNPRPKLSPNFRLANPLDDLDARFAQDGNPHTIDARVRISNANHDSGDAARGDRSRARRRAPVERARLECRVQSRAADLVSVRFSVARSRDLGMILARPLGMSASNERATRVHDHAAHPRVIAGHAPRALRLVDGELEPLFMVSVHRSDLNPVRRERAAPRDFLDWLGRRTHPVGTRARRGGRGRHLRNGRVNTGQFR